MKKSLSMLLATIVLAAVSGCSIQGGTGFDQSSATLTHADYGSL
jgi:hypothetical protein